MPNGATYPVEGSSIIWWKYLLCCPSNVGRNLCELKPCSRNLWPYLYVEISEIRVYHSHPVWRYNCLHESSSTMYSHRMIEKVILGKFCPKGWGQNMQRGSLPTIHPSIHGRQQVFRLCLSVRRTHYRGLWFRHCCHSANLIAGGHAGLFQGWVDGIFCQLVWEKGP